MVPGNQETELLSLMQELAHELHPGRREARVEPESSIERELGLDSVARVELLMRIQRRFGVAIPEEDALTAETARDLLAALSRAQTAAVTKHARPAPSTPVSEPAIEGAPRHATTIVEALEWHAERHGQRVHILLEESEGARVPVTYAALLAESQAVARGLAQRGLEPDEAVALMLPTSRQFFAGFCGVLLAGGIPVPIYPPYRPSQIEDHLRRQAGILSNAQVALLLAPPEGARVARWLETRVDELRAVLTVDDLAAAGAGKPEVRVARRSDDVALLQYTSGSTGDPKGVVLTHGNLLANIRAMGEAAQVEARDVFVSWLPLYHDMGLIGAWLGSLYHAYRLVIMPPSAFLARPERWLWGIHEHRGTLSSAPNFAYELAASRIDEAGIEGLDLSSWRMACNGAEPVSPETLSRFIDRFGPHGFRPGALAPVYGLAECAVGLAFPPPDRPPRIDRVDRDALSLEGRARPTSSPNGVRFVSCGQPLPGHQVRIVDQGGHEAPERTQGRIQFRGPSATRGYFRNERATRALFDGPWLETGDFGYVADGELYITGRTKDVIIRAGRHVFPYELEEAVGALSGVRRGSVAAFASPDERRGTEKLVIVVETRENDAARLAALRAGIEEVTTALVGGAADEVVLAPPRSVPKTSSGKLRRGACRDLYQRGMLGRTRSVRAQVLRLGLAALWSVLRHGWHRLAALAYAAWFWTLFGLMAVPAWLLATLLPHERLRRRLVSAVVRSFFALVGIPLRVNGVERLLAEPHVLVANHASYLDGLVLAAVLPPRYAFVAKIELRRNPFTRVALARMGVEFVERFDPARSAKDSARLEHLAAAGRSLVFFPEGTARRASGLLPFHMGAFVIAARTHMPVVPVAIKGTRTALRADQWFPRRGLIEVTVLPALMPDGTEWEGALALRDRSCALLAQATGETVPT